MQNGPQNIPAEQNDLMQQKSLLLYKPEAL